MKMSGEAMLLRVFIGETDRHEGKPVYEQIVLKARQMNLRGATVLKGILGFGADSRLHSAKIVRLSEDLPVVVEIVDSQENLDKLLPFIDQVVGEGLVTIEPVHVIMYRHNQDDKK